MTRPCPAFALPMGLIAALIGLLTGLVMGLAARFGGFGTMSAIRAMRDMGDQRRIRAWGVVIGVAMVATFALESMGYVRIAASPAQTMLWTPWASILGGVLFGYGMSMAGSCGFEALVRTGAGDLRALVIVAVLGITALAVTAGPLAPLRAMLIPQDAATAPQGAAQYLSEQVGLSAFFFAVLVAAVCIALAITHMPLRRSPGRLLWALAVGLAVAFCLAGTTWMHENTIAKVPVEGPDFAAPLGQAVQFLIGPSDAGTMLGAGLTGGVLLGGLIGAMFRGFFRDHHTEANPTLGRMAFGALLMGLGAGIAGGDLIGQGLSAMATLAWSAPVTIISMLAGAFAGRGWMVSADVPEEEAFEA
jgi:uncharacterized protein